MSILIKRLPPALTVALCTAFSPAGAQQAPRQHTVHFYTWENDSHFMTDRFYTSGVQISSKRSSDRRGWFARDATYALCRWTGCDASTVFATQTNVGQLMFTPRDITRAQAQPEDRPWAGFLYYEQTYSFLSSDLKTLSILSAQLGVTGPASLAEPAQKGLHKLLDRPHPAGWQHQIRSSVGVMVSAEKRRARDALSFDLPGEVRFNTATYWRLAAGTVQTYAAAGIAVVIGKDLPPVSPPPPGIGNKIAAKALPGIGRTSCLLKWLQCTAFASVEGRLMAYNVFLDGRPFRDNEPSVDKRTFVYDVVVGNRFDLPHTRTAQHGPWFLQVKVTKRSPEFRSPIGVPSHRVYALTFGSEF